MQWDLERTEFPTYSVKGHQGIINAIDGMSAPGAPEFATVGRDGCVKVWDPRQPNDPVAALIPSSSSSSSSASPENTGARDCWAVAFGNGSDANERCVAAGYDNGDVKLFDLRMNALRWETNIGVGVCGLEFDRQNIAMNKLVVTGLSGQFRVYDMRTLHPEKGYAHVTMKGADTGHGDSTIWLARHLPQNRDVFMTAGGSGGLSLWKYSYPSERSRKDENGVAMGVAGTCERLQHVSLGTQPVHCFDWSKDKEGLCVFGAFDQCIRVGIVTRLNKVY
jgi:WD40 repeat protein